MVELMHQIDSLVSALALQAPVQPHSRGGFAQQLLGYRHSMGNCDNVSPLLQSISNSPSSFQRSIHITRYGTPKISHSSTPSHRVRKRSLSCEACAIFLFRAEPLTNSKRQVITELLMRYFPGIASLYADVRNFWAKKGATAEFGLFFHLAINVDMGKPVRSIPHRDVMNIAFGICVILPFGPCGMPLLIHNYIHSRFLGFFPHGVMAWLVNMEAGIVVQLPPMVPFFGMSSVITHFNVDKHGKSSITVPPVHAFV